MKAKINLNQEEQTRAKITVGFLLFQMAILGLIYITRQESLEYVQKIDVFLFNILENIKGILDKLLVLNATAIISIVAILIYPRMKLLKQGYTFKEIGEFYGVVRRVKEIKVSLAKIRANTEEAYPTIFLEKNRNMYILIIEKNHWFKKEQLTKNIELFTSVFRMEYMKIYEDFEEFTLYFSDEKITMIYDEFVEKYCHATDEIDDNIVIGYTDEKEIRWHYEDVPHGFVIGTTGSGKSNLIHIMIQEFKRIGATIKGIDGKRKELSRYKKDFEVITEVEDFLPFIKRQHRTMENRNKMLEEKGKDHYTELDLPPIFIVLEEIALILGILSKEKKQGRQSDFQIAEKYLTLIGRAGREMGIFLILTTQDPQVDNIPSSLRGLLNLRILLCPVQEATHLDMMFGSKNRDLPNKEVGYGYVRFEFEPVLFQVPLYPIKKKNGIRPTKKNKEKNKKITVKE